MREIKFRLWSMFSNHMYDYDFYLSLDGTLFQDDDLNYRSKDFYKIMQYTGLKDKNGKDIYEGDILKWDEQEWGSPFNEVVLWDYDRFSWRANDWRQFCEVIGNIYENPSLVEG